MPKITKVFITTDDTGKTYEMGGYGGSTPKDQPQLWAIEVKMSALDNNGQASFGPGGHSPHQFYVERATLERLGMTGRIDTPLPPPEQAVDEVRETLEKLLSLVGIYPEH